MTARRSDTPRLRVVAGGARPESPATTRLRPRLRVVPAPPSVPRTRPTDDPPAAA